MGGCSRIDEYHLLFFINTLNELSYLFLRIIIFGKIKDINNINATLIHFKQIIGFNQCMEEETNYYTDV